MKTTFFLFICIVIATCGSLLAVYSFLFLFPSLQLPKQKLAMKQTITHEYTAVLQHRLALVQLSKLDPSSSGYLLAKDRVYALMENTQLPDSTNPDIFAQFESISKKHTQLRDDFQQLLTTQQQILDEQKTFDKKVDVVFSYFPEQDIGHLDPSTQHDEIQTRITAASVGIATIGRQLPSVSAEVTRTQRILTTKDVHQISKQFTVLKRAIYAQKIELLANHQTLVFLKDETELLNRYEALLAEVDGLK